MKSSEILREAKVLLWDGDPCTEGKRYICHAISMAAWNAWATHNSNSPIKVKEALVAEIERRLQGFPTVEDWLNHFVPSSREFIRLRARFLGPESAVIQAYRHRWLDALIAEYEAKGD